MKYLVLWKREDTQNKQGLEESGLMSSLCNFSITLFKSGWICGVFLMVEIF